MAEESVRRTCKSCRYHAPSSRHDRVCLNAMALYGARHLALLVCRCCSHSSNTMARTLHEQNPTHQTEVSARRCLRRARILVEAHPAETQPRAPPLLKLATESAINTESNKGASTNQSECEPVVINAGKLSSRCCAGLCRRVSYSNGEEEARWNRSRGNFLATSRNSLGRKNTWLHRESPCRP